MSGFDASAYGLELPLARPRLPGAAPQTVAAVLDRVLQEDPQREALIGRHARYCYGELDVAANRAAHALLGLGVTPGDRVAASLPNDTEIVVAFLGAMRIGAIWVGVNRQLAPPEKEYLLLDSGASILLGDSTACAEIEPQRDHVDSLVHVLRADPGDTDGAWARALASASGDPLSDRFAIDPFAPAAIAYTSGTTGFPKGAVHSQHNLLLPGAVVAASGAFGPSVPQGAVLPLTILNLMVLVPLVAFQDGSACVAMDRIDAPGVAEWVRKERVGNFAAVPTVLHDLLTHPDVDPSDLESLRRPGVGGADCPDEFQALYRERFGKGVTIGYGLTEAPTAVTWSDPDQPIAGSCGRAVAQVDITVRDEQCGVLPPGTVGEVCVGPAAEGPFAGVYTPFLGYWGQPDATREALAGGVLHTGDLGELDAEGNLFIRGRRKELILRGGANVYPAEIERVLHEDRRVAACAVVGRPDRRLGETVVAFVQPEPGAVVTADELRAHCAERLARYKLPAELHFVDEFPRNAMGKIVKRQLLDSLAAHAPPAAQ